MPRVAKSALSKYKSTTRRRRTGVLTKAKYKPKTTRANRTLIKGNALAIRSIRRLMPAPVYTDWQYTGVQNPFTDSAPTPYFTIQVTKLMEPNLWNSVLRKDANVLESSMTRVKRMSMNLRYSLGQSNYVQITTFVVSLRKDAANRTFDNIDLVAGEDYIFSGSQQNFNPRLNSQTFKVHYTRNVSLTSNTWLEDKAIVGSASFAGNPNTTMAKGQVSLQLDYNLRQPLGTPWRQMVDTQFPPHQRLYLLTFFKGKTVDVDDISPRLDYDALYTCYNAG